MQRDRKTTTLTHSTHVFLFVQPAASVNHISSFLSVSKQWIEYSIHQMIATATSIKQINRCSFYPWKKLQFSSTKMLFKQIMKKDFFMTQSSVTIAATVWNGNDKSNNRHEVIKRFYISSWITQHVHRRFHRNFHSTQKKTISSSFFR